MSAAAQKIRAILFSSRINAAAPTRANINKSKFPRSTPIITEGDKIATNASAPSPIERPLRRANITANAAAIIAIESQVASDPLIPKKLSRNQIGGTLKFAGLQAWGIYGSTPFEAHTA